MLSSSLKHHPSLKHSPSSNHHPPKVRFIRSALTPKSKSKATRQHRKPSKQIKNERDLQEHQRRIVRYMLTHRGALVYHGMGSGKTRIAVALVAVLKLPTIVVLPASLHDNFVREIRRAGVDDALFRIVSTKAFLTQDIDCRDKILIVDEAHYLRNPQGKISQKVVRCAEHAKKVLLLTGTPVVNRPSDIAPLLNMIVKGHIRLPIQTGIFSRKIFTDIPTGDSFDATFGENGLNEVGKALWKELFPCVFSYYSTPISPDYPKLKIIDVRVPMAAYQQKVYSAWESRNLTRPMVEMLMSKSGSVDIEKLPQFRAYLDGGRRICNVVTEPDGTLIAPKFEEAMNIIEKSNGKAMIFSHYLSKGIDVDEDFVLNRGYSFVKFTGKESKRKKQAAVEKYNANRVKIFMLSSAGGVGLDLHDTDTAHIMDPGWNEADIYQAIYRVVRFKSHRTPNSVVTVYRYYCYRSANPPSADTYLMNLSLRKEKINQEFLSYATKHAIETRDVGSCIIDEL